MRSFSGVKKIIETRIAVSRVTGKKNNQKNVDLTPNQNRYIGLATVSYVGSGFHAQNERDHRRLVPWQLRGDFA